MSARLTSRACRALTALAIAAALAGCTGKGKGGPGGPGSPDGGGPPEVGVVTLALAPVVLSEALPGRTSPYEISDVRPQVTGLIKARLFQEGSMVRAGQPLYRIDSALYRAAYDQGLAQLANARASVVTAKAKADRYGDLVKINAVSKQDYDDARAAFAQGEANVRQQAAAVETARINLAYATVTAPISGRIGASAVTQGALVSAQQPTAMATIQRLDPIYVDITQSAEEALRLRREAQGGQIRADGVAVRLKLADGGDYGPVGRLQFTDVTVDPASGGVTLRAVFPNPAGLLLPGLYVRAIVDEGILPAGLLAPQQGIARDERGQPTALVVGADGKAQLRPVTVSRAVGNAWLVTGGLKAGDRLIVEGTQKVKPGDAVRAVPAGAPPPPALNPAAR